MLKDCDCKRSLKQMQLSDRKKKILQVVIDEYIQTAMPVSSKVIVEKYLTNVSSATVRHELSSLEELGLLNQKHTSGGRVPTVVAYRFYIEEFMYKHKLPKKLLVDMEENFTKTNLQIGNILSKVGEVISNLTAYTTIARTPKRKQEKLTSVLLRRCGERQALLIILTQNKIFRDKVIELDYDMTEEELNLAANFVTEVIQNKTVDEVQEVTKYTLFQIGQYQMVMQAVMQALYAYLDTQEEEVVLSGVDKILQYPEYEDINHVKDFFSILANKEKLINLVEDTPQQEAKSAAIQVKIGDLDVDSPLAEHCSIVTASYAVHGEEIGTFGVIGPVRMDYGKVISILENVGKILEQCIPDKNK